MKLYFIPNSCSLAAQIVLRELNIPFELIHFDSKSKVGADGKGIVEINPRGYVPALVLDNGRTLVEAQVIIRYLAATRPEARLAPVFDNTWPCWEFDMWLEFISTEIHRSFNCFFMDGFPEEGQAIYASKLARRFDYLQHHMDKREYVAGDRFSIADAYLFTVLRWTAFVSIDIGRWPALARFLERISERPSVKESLAAEDSDAQAGA